MPLTEKLFWEIGQQAENHLHVHSVEAVKAIAPRTWTNYGRKECKAPPHIAIPAEVEDGKVKILGGPIPFDELRTQLAHTS